MNLIDALKKQATQALANNIAMPGASLTGAILNSTGVPAAILSKSMAPIEARYKANTINAKQIIAGVVDPFMSGSKTGYVPAAVDYIPALGSVVQNVVTGKEHKGYMAGAAERVGRAYDRTNKFVGVEEPQGLEQNVARAAGSMLIPGPKLPAATTLLGKAARFGAEVLLPLRQTRAVSRGPYSGAIKGFVKSGPAIAVQAAIGTAIGNDDPRTVPAYNGKADQTDEMVYDQAPAPPNDEMVYEGGSAPASHDEMVYDVPPAVVNQRTAAQDAVPLPEGMSITDKAMLGVITGAGLLGAVAGSHQLVRNMTRGRLAITGGNLIGKKIIPQQTGAIDKIVSGTVQSDQAVRTAVDKTTTPLEAKQIKSKMDRLISSSINARASHALETGQLPNSAVNLGPVAGQIEGIMSSLDDEGKMLLSRGLAARSALNTINRNKPAEGEILSQFSYKEDGSPMTMEDLKGYADVLSDSKLSSVADIVPGIYRKLADYYQEGGIIDSKVRQSWLKANPDYVHLGLAIEEGHGSPFKARSVEEGGGVQTGQVADPVVELPKQIAAAVRRVELNKGRRTILEALVDKPGYGIKTVENAGVDTVSVRVDGKEVHYKVPDASIREQLAFSPTIMQNGFAQLGRAITALPRASTVGRIFNPLFSFTSAIYDSGGAMLNKGRETHLGLINEWLNKSGLPIKSIGIFDPTGNPLFDIPVGTMRYIWDSSKQQISKSLSESMINSDSLWSKMMPDPESRQYHADRLLLAYDASVKSMMAREGILASNMFSHADDLNPAHGIEANMPGYARWANQQAMQEAVQNKSSFLEKLFQGSKNVGVAANSTWFARAYNTFSNAVRESVRYQATAANVDRFASVDDFASAMRRLSGDMGQRGGKAGTQIGKVNVGEAFQSTSDWSMFVNAGIQPLAEWLKLAKNDPKSFIVNALSTTIGALSIQYLAAAMDPDVADRIRNATDQELAGRIYLPLGIIAPMVQPLRPVWGPLVVALNEMTGLNDGMMDPNIINWFASLQHGLSEETKFGMGKAAITGLGASNPLNPANSPVLAAGAAGLGVNLPQSLYSGTPITIKEPDESGIANQAGASRWGQAINALVGASVSHHIASVYEAATALGFGADLDNAANIMIDREKDFAAKSTGPVESMLFKNREKLISSNDTPLQLYYDKKDGIDKAATAYRKDIKYPGMTGANPRVDRMLPTQLIDPLYRNTMLAPVGEEVAVLTRILNRSKAVDKLNDIKQQERAIKDLDRQPFSTAEQKNHQINNLLEERQKLVSEINIQINIAEEKIRARIGDPGFKLNDIDIDRLKKTPYDPRMNQAQALPFNEIDRQVDADMAEAEDGEDKAD